MAQITNPGTSISKFSYNNFNYSDLLNEKEKKGLKIGVGIPVKNEEDTLGRVLDSLEVHKSNGLIDSFAVFDSSSTDSSGIITESKGVDFIVDSYMAQKLGIEKETDWKSGKGFNLWASLNHFADHDLVTWVDSDIDLVPRFFYGILGPLIMDENTVFSKGTYERDMGDNRINSYTVDPVLGLLFPEAGQLSDPLCGFFGGRVDFLKEMPFSTGYSVEIATTIHALMSDPKNGIAQVNLGELVNRNHPDNYMSAMGATITHAIFELAVKYGKIPEGIQLADTIVQRDCASSDMINRPLVDFQDIVLPPMQKYLNKSNHMKS